MTEPVLADLLQGAKSPMQEATILLGKKMHTAFTPEEQNALKYMWPLWARYSKRLPAPKPPKKEPGYGIWSGQIPPNTPWTHCLFLAGRGSGKTAAGSNWIINKARQMPDARLAVVGATASDVWGTMVQGESGILAYSPPWFYPKIQTTRRRLVYPNGAQLILYSADQPARLRGPNHSGAWVDELLAWRRLDAWTQLQFTLRSGTHPQTFITTTPKPLRILFDLIEDQDTALLTGTTYDNAANLSQNYFKAVIAPREGTALGRVEVLGELLEEMPGALWRREWFQYVTEVPRMERIVVGVDPAETSGKDADDTGIVVCGLGSDGKGYILEDASIHSTPEGWGKQVTKACARHNAGLVVIDCGRNGEMARSVIKLIEPNIRVKTKGGNLGKRAWAEPVSALYEQGKVFHLTAKDANGKLKCAKLEDQMVTWTDEVKDWSPDRLDACVYALSELMVNKASLAKQAGLNAQSIGSRRM